MQYEIIQPNNETAVTLAEAKKHMRITDTEQDDMILLYIRTAENFILRRRNLALKPTQFKVTIDKDITGEAVLPICPVKSIDGGYSFASGQPSKIQGNIPAGTTLTMTAGFDEIPFDLKAAVLLYVSERYENREVNSVARLNQIELGFIDLINHWGFTS